jgi:hypothetical protein
VLGGGRLLAAALGDGDREGAEAETGRDRLTAAGG